MRNTIIKKHTLSLAIAAAVLALSACANSADPKESKVDESPSESAAAEVSEISENTKDTENAESASESETSEDAAAPTEKISIGYLPATTFEVTDEDDIKELMTLLDEIITLMPDNVSNDSYEEFGGQTGYSLNVGDKTYFVNFENSICPNFECDFVEYNIPQEKIDALKVTIDRIVTEHGYEPYQPSGN